jgi:hypothetical protein
MLGASLGMWFASQKAGRNPQLHCCEDLKTHKMEIKYKYLQKNKNLDYIRPT